MKTQLLDDHANASAGDFYGVEMKQRKTRKKSKRNRVESAWVALLENEMSAASVLPVACQGRDSDAHSWTPLVSWHRIAGREPKIVDIGLAAAPRGVAGVTRVSLQPDCWDSNTT